VDGACGFGSCVDDATVPLFFARADGSGDVGDVVDSQRVKKGLPNTSRPIDSTLATWYWTACIGLALALSFIVAVAAAAAAKRYCSESNVVNTPNIAAECVVGDHGESI
jgi:hypothetical protein